MEPLENKIGIYLFDLKQRFNYDIKSISNNNNKINWCHQNKKTHASKDTIGIVNRPLTE